MSDKNKNFYNNELYKWFLLGVAFAGTTSTFTNRPEAGTSRINTNINNGVVQIKRE